MIERAELVVEAQSWIPTPYVRKGRIKHVGCDCGSYPAEVFTSTGVLDVKEIGHYAGDWFFHASDERYFRDVMKLAKLIAETRCFANVTIAQPGDIVLAKVIGSERYNHAGIVIKWPRIIHCVKSTGVGEVDAHRDPMWEGKEIAIFNPWEKP